jgi:peptide deformylase
LTNPRSPIQEALDQAAWLTSQLPIRLAGDPVLNTRCEPVTGDELDSGQARKWAMQMTNFLTAYREHTGTGRGLAANQLGIAKQIVLILLDSGDLFEPGSTRINDGDRDKIMKAELKRIR